MGFSRVLSNALSFVRLLRQADAYFQQERPDAVVLIDYPGFHWWLARRAKAHGIPVFYFVPPQLWAWAGWRIKKCAATSITSCAASPSRSRGIATAASRPLPWPSLFR